MVSSRVVETITQVLVGAILISLPLWAGDYNANQVGLLLLYGMAAQGVALCWGGSGFLPLGQALFFGLGAYLSAFILKLGTGGAGAWAYAGLPLAIMVPGLLAYGVGRLVFVKRIDSGPFFSLITLALCMLGYLVANNWSSLTGGFNGLSDVPDLPFTDRYGNLYYVIAAASIACTALLTWISRRPIGTLWSAIAQNEDRLQFFGFATDRLKALAFGISGAVAGLGGTLYAPHEGLVSPQSTSVALSAQFVIWAAVGGKQGALGAQLGTLAIGLLAAMWRDQFAYWEVLVAVVFLIIVRLFPDGIAGIGKFLMARFGIGSARKVHDKSIAAPGQIAGTQSNGSGPALVFSDVRSTQGTVNILNGLSLEIAATGISCFIGPNGAGKTSTFNAMTGRLPVQSGRIQLSGKTINDARAWQVAQLGVGRKFQIPTVFDQLTVDENLQIALWGNRLSSVHLFSKTPLYWGSTQRERILKRFAFLEDRMRVRAGELSQGMRQMLEFAMVAITEPRLLLLDEPCAGLSSHETHHMMEAITATVRELDASALVIEHDMSALEKIASRVIVLHQGRTLATGSLDEIKASQEVQAVYSGGRK